MPEIQAHAERLTDESIKAIAVGCASLTELAIDVASCDRLTSGAVATLELTRPSLCIKID